MNTEAAEMRKQLTMATDRGERRTARRGRKGLIDTIMEIVESVGVPDGLDAVGDLRDED